MHLFVSPVGTIHCVYDEAVPLHSLGRAVIRRASYVEPNDAGQWMADLSPVSGPVLGPFAFRSEALEAERAWLDAHWLPSTSE